MHSIPRNSKIRAFTVVELMIVVLVLSILLAVAVPSWMGARERAREGVCHANLRMIEHAKEQFAMEGKKQAGDSVANSDIWPTYLKSRTFPQCPEGGAYTVGAIGTDPSCSVHGSLP